MSKVVNALEFWTIMTGKYLPHNLNFQENLLPQEVWIEPVKSGILDLVMSFRLSLDILMKSWISISIPWGPN
jgi:hypothetical protein